MKKYYLKNKLNKKQLAFKTTLEDMADILENNKIHFFLFGGTALGAHREQNFIEYDTDIDLGIFENSNIIEVINIINKSDKFKIKYTFPLYLHLSDDNTTEVSYIHTKTNVKVDIFKLFKQTNNKYMQYVYSGICDLKTNKRCELLFSLKIESIIFLNRKYYCPDKDYLSLYYGNDWKIPRRYTNWDEGLQQCKSLIN